MTLQSRLAELITAVGADIKAIPNARTGWGPPTNAIGKVGEYYVDLSNLDVYGPKAVRAPAKVTGLTGQLHPNPSVEASTAGWVVSAAAGGGVNVTERTQDRAQDGTWSYHSKIDRIASASASLVVATNSSGASGIAVDPLLPYSAAMRVYGRTLANIGAGSAPGRIRMYWFKADGSASVVNASSIPNAGTEITPVVGQWTEHNYENQFPPSDAAFCRLCLYPGSSPAAGEYIFETDIDSVTFVQGTEVPKWGAPIGKLFASVAPSIVTVLPSSPVDGQEVYYTADGTNNVIWNLRYRSASTKWEFVGGAALYAEDLASRTSINNSPNYTALATALSITAPLAGTYEVEYDVSVTQTAAGTGVGFFSDIAWGANVGNDQNCSAGYMSGSGHRASMGKTRRITCAAGDVVSLVHKAGSTNFSAHARTMSLKPVAVS